MNGTVTVNLSALAQIVDTLGGLPLCQPVAVTSIHTGRTFPVGCYQLDGAGVTDLVRQRHDYPTGGYFRDRVVQGVLISLLRKVVLIDIRPARRADAGATGSTSTCLSRRFRSRWPQRTSGPTTCSASVSPPSIP